MKIRWLFTVFALVLVGAPTAFAETLYCNNNARRDTIDGGRICDPHGAVSLKCMGYTGREIAAKTACYAERDACFARIKAENEQIKRENDLYYKCKEAFYRDKNKKSSNTQSKWKSRLGEARQRNQDMSGAKRRNDEAYEKAVNNEVKKTEKINRRNAVQADKEYRAMRERERKEAADRQRRTKESTKIKPRRSIVRSKPNSCGPDPRNSCGTPSNPCWHPTLVKWDHCMGIY